MGPERTLENRIGRDCKARGWLWLKLQGPKGWPDRTVIAEGGKLYFVEVKAPNGRLSPAQKQWASELGARGQVVVTVWNFEGWQEVAEQWARIH